MKVDITASKIEELEKDINLYKDLNCRLLKENTDLKIENARLKVKAELVDCFSEKEGNRYANRSKRD